MSAHGRQPKFSPQRPQLKAYTVSRRLYTPSRGVGAPKPADQQRAVSKKPIQKPALVNAPVLRSHDGPHDQSQPQKNTPPSGYSRQLKITNNPLSSFSPKQKPVLFSHTVANKSRQSPISAANNTDNVISDFKPYALPTRTSKSNRLQELDKQAQTEELRISQKKQQVYAKMQQNDFFDDNQGDKKTRTNNDSLVQSNEFINNNLAIRKRRAFPLSRFFKQPKQYYLTVGAAVFVLLLGVGVSVYTLLVNQETKEQVAVLSEATTGDDQNNGQLSSGSVPDESDQDDDMIRNHQVAPDMPRYLRIPSIGVDHRIIQVGVNDNNQLGSPASIHDVGWYTGSAKPGASGASLMDGHVSGPTKAGVFKNLTRLEAGDVIEVERGDGRVIEYEVVKKQSYPYEETDMQSALVSAENGKNGLNLITCDGRFNASANNYENRLIVYAVEV